MKFSLIKFEDLHLKENYVLDKVPIYEKDPISMKEIYEDISKYPIIQYILDVIVGNNMIHENFCYELAVEDISEYMEDYQVTFLKYFERIYVIKIEGIIKGFALNKVSNNFKRFITENENEVFSLLNDYKIFRYDKNMSFNTKTDHLYEITEINAQGNVDRLIDYVHIVKYNIDTLGYSYIPLKGYDKQEVEVCSLIKIVSTIAKHIYVITTPEVDWKTQGIIIW